MVKKRPGSRKGQTKFTTAAYKSAKKRAAKLGQSRQGKESVIHDAMRDAWDESATPAGNLSRLGLVANLNIVHKDQTTTHRRTPVGRSEAENATMSEAAPLDKVARNVLSRLEAHAAMPERGTKQVVRPGERVALQRLVKRYGEDWSAMARDTKLNYLQWTPNQLQKKIERMQSILSSEQN